MSKRYLIPVYDVGRVVVTEEIYSYSADEWDDLDALQGYVDGIVEMMPAAVPDFKKRSSKMVLSADGKSGFATWETWFDGVPHLSYDDAHIDDIAWANPVLSKRFLAGPSWANDS